jgi:hypothetical protein
MSEERMKCCANCGSPRIIGRQGNDYECMDCDMINMGFVWLTQERSQELLTQYAGLD